MDFEGLVAMRSIVRSRAEPPASPDVARPPVTFEGASGGLSGVSRYAGGSGSRRGRFAGGAGADEPPPRGVAAWASAASSSNDAPVRVLLDSFTPLPPQTLKARVTS